MCEVKGNYYSNDWWPCKNSESVFYTCQIQNHKVDQKNIINFNGTHKPGKSNEDVIGVRFDECEMNFIPTGVVKAFPNMKILLIFTSKIDKITKEDFAEYSQITQLWFSGCSFEYLPGNLLDLMPNLEIISFQTCKVKYIDSNFFDNHPNLKVAKFNSNINIDCWYDSVSGNTGAEKVTYDELKEKINEEKLQPPADYFTYYKMPRGLTAALKSFLNDESNKDLLITVEGEDYKLHSIVAKARSGKMREMIDDCVELDFNQFSAKNFEIVSNFLYTDELDEDADMIEMLKIANFLEIPDLKVHAMKHLDLIEVTQDNALDVMKVGKEIGSKELQDNAFTEIKKMLPEKELKEEWVNDYDKIKIILEAKEKMEDEIRKAKEKFDELFL